MHARWGTMEGVTKVLNVICSESFDFRPVDYGGTLGRINKVINVLSFDIKPAGRAGILGRVKTV